MDTIVPVQKDDSLYVILSFFLWIIDILNFHNIRIKQIAFEL